MNFFSTFLLLTILLFNGKNDIDPNGIYRSKNNQFERFSEMRINKNGTFIYKYGLSACQDEITGKYQVQGKKIKFEKDIEFTKKFLQKQKDSLVKIDSTYKEMEILVYPELGVWKLNSKYIKPGVKIDFGCIVIKEKHIKIY